MSKKQKHIRMCKQAVYNGVIDKTMCLKDRSYRNQCKMSSCPHFIPTLWYKILRRSILKKRQR